MIEILTVDPRARLITVRGLGTLQMFFRAEPRRRFPCIVVSKPRGGTARTRVVQL